jgi:hypothetical protein
MSQKQEIQRKRVYKFYNEHKDNGKLFTLNNFKTEHIGTIYIQRTENDSGYNRRRGSGRKPIKLPPNDCKPNSKGTINFHIVWLQQNTVFCRLMCTK